MKKLVTVFLAAAIVFAIAGQASATALETSGEYRARLWYLGNYLVDKKDAEFWDQRLRLTMVWPVAEGVKLTARADIMEGWWGDFVLSGTTTEGGTTYSAAKNGRDQISFDWLNLEFKIPNSAFLVRVGRQDASWGSGLFVKADNRDRFRLEGAWGETKAVYTYDKYIEVGQYHETDSLDDRRQHSLGVTTKLGGWSTGLIVAAIQNNTDPAVDAIIWGPDVFANGKLGPVDLKFEGFYLTGKNDNKDNAKDQDLEAWGAYLGAFMPAGLVNLGLEGIAVSGDDPGTKDKNEGAVKADYHVAFWSVVLFNNMDCDGYRGESSFGGDTSVSNAWAAKLSGGISPVKGLNLYGALVYAARLEDTAAHKADPLGTEIDLVATYAITENVSWTVGGGYVMAGDFYGEVDDPWGAVSAFTVKF